MNIFQENKCIELLSKVLDTSYDKDEYCLHGYKDSAVCMDKIDDKWEVYESDRGNKFDVLIFDTLIEACFDVIKRMGVDGKTEQLKTLFCEYLIPDHALTA